MTFFVIYCVSVGLVVLSLLAQWLKVGRTRRRGLTRVVWCWVFVSCMIGRQRLSTLGLVFRGLRCRATFLSVMVLSTWFGKGVAGVGLRPFVI